MRNSKSEFPLAQRLEPYLFLSPIVVLVGFLVAYPLYVAATTSLYESQFLGGKVHFVGLANYHSLFSSSEFWRSAKLTLVFALGIVAGCYIFGLITALLLTNSFRGRGVARALIILPFAVPEVVLALLWRWIYNPQYGVANFFLRKLGIIDASIQWLTDPRFALIAVLIVAIWKLYPVATLILLAGLQAIPEELYEAADVDGAGYLSKLRHITLPGLRYVSEVLILLLSIWGLRSFGIIWLLTEGGPFGATNTLVINTYRYAFRYFDGGSATSLGLVIVSVCLIFSICYYLIVMRTK